MPKELLITLRNLALGLHANAGLMITVPTNGAIADTSDPQEIKAAMMAYLTLISIESIHIWQTLGLTPAEIQAQIAEAVQATS